MVMAGGVRAFVALKMAPEVEESVADFIESLRMVMSGGKGVRWTNRLNLHLTVRFLGDGVAASTLERLDDALKDVAAVTTRFGIGVRGIGAFPNLSRPRVLWVGMESAELLALANRIERAAVAAGLAPERRAFAPHLTIARVGDLAGWPGIRRAVEAASKRDFGATAVRALTLYRSILGRGSPVYEELGHYPFARENS
jgi:RNA 2',3'-cyclic 3'-phosphodiesterase